MGCPFPFASSQNERNGVAKSARTTEPSQVALSSFDRTSNHSHFADLVVSGARSSMLRVCSVQNLLPCVSR